LSLDTTALDVLHAALEAVALRLVLVYELLAPHAAPDHVIVASGGAISRSRAWTRCSPTRSAGRSPLGGQEASRGAALLALEGLGAIPTSARSAPLGRVFEPDCRRPVSGRVGAP
jgi:sugar (pentulose or hexulose) kinase